MFFIGDTSYTPGASAGVFSFQSGSIHDNFFVVFAIVFPAFAGMTAGVGLAGDLKNPSRSIPIGITAAAIIGMIVYILVAYKFAISASIDDLSTDYYVMRKISALGFIFVPLGLAAATISSAISFSIVAPRTLRALALDGSLPIKSLNRYAARGSGKSNELSAAKTITSIIAICIVVAGELDSVARIITMLFMVTYGSICLISFLYHFGGDPSYRPVFRSKWYLSLIGFAFCLLLMFKIDSTYAIISLSLMTLLYLYISNIHKERSGIQEIFKGVIFQLSRRLQIYIQKNTRGNEKEKWRPSIVCISKNSLERDKAMRLLEWISEKYGFGTYIHLIEDYFSENSNNIKNELRKKLIDRAGSKSNIYIDMLISPSFTSAIAQTIQLPGVSGMPNNMILFEFDRQKADGLRQISENLSLAKAANLDIGIYSTTNRKVRFKNGIHIWITDSDISNTNLMILLGFVIISHPEWVNSRIRIFEIVTSESKKEQTNRLLNNINSGRLPISPSHIEFIEVDSEESISKKINEYSNEAGLVIMDFQAEQIKVPNDLFFEGFGQMGDMLFVNASTLRALD
jgi:amino acid transporter